MPNRTLVAVVLLVLFAWCSPFLARADSELFDFEKKAAELGNADSQIALGDMYFRGDGVPQDYAEAEKWFRKAAEQGKRAAQHFLGLMYLDGKAVPQNYAEAEKWFRKAAEQGAPASQYELGEMYRDGKGVPQDFVLAHKWFNIVAAHGSPIAIKNRETVEAKMTAEQIAEAQKLAREWKPTKEQGGK